MARNEEEKDRAALIIIPIIAGAGALWYFLSRRVVAGPDKAVLMGKVTDADTGGGVGGATVLITGGAGGYQVNTSPNGNYQIPDVEPGVYNGEVTHPNYQPAYF